MSQRRIFSTVPTPSTGGSRVVGAPGASGSPQMPGQVPDRSGVPGQGQMPFPSNVDAPRPLTQGGSAQEIVGVYAAHLSNPEQVDNPARFEQAAATYEEMRKADPSLLTPVRPLPGYDLDATPAIEGGEAAPGEFPALAEGVALTSNKPVS